MFNIKQSQGVQSCCSLQHCDRSFPLWLRMVEKRMFKSKMSCQFIYV